MIVKGLSPEEANIARKKYYEKNKGVKDEIERYVKMLRNTVDFNLTNSYLKNLRVDGEGYDPVDLLTIDGESRWCLLYDFDVDEKGDIVKVYTDLNWHKEERKV